jgi:hypothetical protein
VAREWLRHPRLVTPCAASHSAIESPSCGGRLTKPPPGHTTIAAPVACPGAGRNTRTAGVSGPRQRWDSGQRAKLYALLPIRGR